MTTTPNPTAEQRVEQPFHSIRAFFLNEKMWEHEEHHVRVKLAGEFTRRMLERVVMSKGALSEEQIERAARALYDTEPIRYALSIHYEKVGEPKPWDALNEGTKGVYRRKAIKVLTAAGVAPQESSKCTSAYCNPRDGEHVSSCPNRVWPVKLDPKKVVALLDALDEAERERDRYKSARSPLELTEESIRQRKRAEVAEAALERVRAMIDNHRSIEQHNEMVPITDVGSLIREPSSSDYLAALAPVTEEGDKE